MPAECCAQLPSLSCEAEQHAVPESDSLAFPKGRGPQETRRSGVETFGGSASPTKAHLRWGTVVAGSSLDQSGRLEAWISSPPDRDGGLHERDLRRRTAFFDVGTRKNPRGADRSELPLWGFPPPKVANGAVGLTRSEIGMSACA